MPLAVMPGPPSQRLDADTGPPTIDSRLDAGSADSPPFWGVPIPRRVIPFSNPWTYASSVEICSANEPGGWPRRASPSVRGFRKLGLSQQAIRFMPHRGRKVAYAVVGSGPPLLLDLGRAHDLEAFWRHPPYRRLVQRLGQRFTVVRWDRPGFGLSDRH